MSKNSLNQRYCYKINSDLIRRSKGNVKITNIREAIKNRLIVGIGDSTGTRMIRDILELPYNEDYINDIKYQIKLKTKALKTAESKTILRNEIKKLNEELLKASLQDCLCNVVFKSDKDYDTYSQKGFKLNGHKYTMLLGTAGGIKMNTVLFIREDVYEEVDKRINNGADFSIPMLPSKLMAYKSLTFSSSMPVTFTPNILVVEDVETSFNATVTYIDFPDELDAPRVQLKENYEVINNACDGCGLIMPKLAEVWGNDLRLEYTPSGFVIRNSWMKGVLTAFDFKAYAQYREDMRGKKIKDVWGKEWDINDVDIIMNRSMFKLSKHYNSLEHYLDNCEENGYGFSVTKWVHKDIENERTLNYQYIQCLNLNDEDIDNLLRDNVKNIKDIIGADYQKTILFGKGKDLTEQNVWFKDAKDDYHIRALMVNPYAINDDYVKDKVKRSIQKRVDLLKTGKISVKGNYQIAIGEPIIQLESAFGLEPKGILKANEFYIEYWRKLGVDKVGAFRSPMSCKENAKVMNVSYNEEAIKWYSGIENMIIFNAWDTTMASMNGEDFDGDINFTTSNPIIVNGIFNDLPTIFCEGKTSSKIANPTKKDFAKAIKDGFGNKVGSVTNFGSSCYDKLSLFEEGTKEYEELDRRIMSIQYLQQECIDSAKNGLPPKPIPSYWNNRDSKKLEIFEDKENGVLKEGITDEEIEQVAFYQRILVDKKPYYFRYIYQDTNKKYTDFVKTMEASCLRGFGKTIEELRLSENRTIEEQEFLDRFNDKMPLSDNPCIINKIAHKVESEFEGVFGYNRKDKDFDYSIYQYDGVKEKATPKQIKELCKLYEEYKGINKNIKTNSTKLNKDDYYNYVITVYDILSKQIREIIPNEEVLVNTLIELSYNKTKISKTFAWSFGGDLILKCMLSKFGNKITFPIRDAEGDIEFDGETFKMIEIIIEEEDD